MNCRPKLNVDNLRDEMIEKITFSNSLLWMQLLFLAAAVLFFSIICYTAYTYTVKPINMEQIPLIQKDEMPLRTKPDNPGGIVFSNQDKAIYNNLRDSSSNEEGPTESSQDMKDIHAIISSLDNKPDKEEKDSIFDVVEGN